MLRFDQAHEMIYCFTLTSGDRAKLFDLSEQDLPQKCLLA